MIKYLTGDLLESNCNIICHQVNLQGVMGGGLALQIATKHPNCEIEYRQVCVENYKSDLCGNVFFYRLNDHNEIANCFSQNEDFTTNYDWLKFCVKSIKKRAELFNYKTVGIPFKYGCGIAKGNWETVEKIWCDSFRDSNIVLQIWKFKGENV